jgi:hypothetical protein
MQSISGIKESASLTMPNLFKIIESNKEELLSKSYVVVVFDDNSEKIVFDKELSKKWEEFKSLVSSKISL